MKLTSFVFLLGVIAFGGCTSEKGQEYFENYRQDESASNLVIQRVEIDLKTETFSPRPSLTFNTNLILGLVVKDSDSGLEDILPVKKGEFSVEAALYETELGSNRPARLIATAPARNVPVKSGLLAISELTMSVVGMPEADFTRPQENRAKWEIYFRVVPEESGGGLSPAEGYFAYHPGKGPGHVVSTAEGTLEEMRRRAGAAAFDSAQLVPRLLPRQMEYRFKGRDFSVDAYLNLTQTREYRITMSPQVFYPYVFQNGGPTYVGLKPGSSVDISLVFVAQGVGVGRAVSFENKRFLSRFDTKGSVDNNGQIVVQAPLVVDFAEEPYLDSGTEVYVELRSSSVAAQPQLGSQLFESRKPLGSGALNPEPGSVADLQALWVPKEMPLEKIVFGGRLNPGTITKPRLPWRESPYQLLTGILKRGKKLHEVDVTEGEGVDPRLAQFGWTNEQWRARLAGQVMTDLSALPKVKEIVEPRPDPLPSARFLMGRAQSTTRCHQPDRNESVGLDLSPLSLFARGRAIDLKDLPEGKIIETPFTPYQLKEITLIDQVNSPLMAPPIVQDITWQTTASFFNEVAEFEREAKQEQIVSSWEGGVMGYVNAGASVEVEVGAKFFGNGSSAKAFGSAGIDARYGWWHRDQEVDVTEVGTMTDRRDRVTISENSVVFGEQRTFDLDATLRRCLLLTSRDPKSPEAFLVCSRKKEEVTETWYYLADFDFKHEMPVERRDLRERMLIKMIRGEKAYHEFRQMMTSGAREFAVKRAKPIMYGVTPLLQDAFIRRDTPHAFFRDGGKFPGVIELKSGKKSPLPSNGK